MGTLPICTPRACAALGQSLQCLQDGRGGAGAELGPSPWDTQSSCRGLSRGAGMGQMWGAGVQGASSGWAEAPIWCCLPGVLVALQDPAAGTHILGRRVAFNGTAFPSGGAPAVCAQEEGPASSSRAHTLVHPCFHSGERKVLSTRIRGCPSWQPRPGGRALVTSVCGRLCRPCRGSTKR